ncbi:MAG: metal ABC transporter permease [Sedimentisphaerales bacterium]|nr:metal ABC transporter permease [Sedimentisphaerales bacterium]
MSEAVRLFLLQISLIAVVLVLHTYIGLHIIRRTLIFSDLVLDQLAAFGALVGVMVGINYASPVSYVFAFIAVIVGAFLLAVLNPRSRAIPREAVIGILYAMALVVSLLLTDKIKNGQALVEKTLSGYLLWVNGSLVAVTAGVYIILIVFHYCLRHRFITLAESPGALKNEKLWDFLLFTTQGIVTVLIVPIAGVLLAYAFLMIPAAIATLFTKKWIPAVALGWTVGFGACLLGLFSSYHFSLPYGPTLVLCMGAAFVGAMPLQYVIFRRGRTKKKGLEPCHS